MASLPRPKALDDLSRKIEAGKGLRVGFLEGAKYPDEAQTPVAYVAALQNFGSGPIPPRPFFSNMIEDTSMDWGGIFAGFMEHFENDTEKALEALGEVLVGFVQDAIVAIDSPPLSPITLMLKKMRREGVEINGTAVGIAARRVADGESYAGESEKPLIDTSHMLNSVNYEVET